MKVLVTGGGGFLGGAIVTLLVQRGDRVTSFSRRSYPWLEHLGVEQFCGDLADREAVEKACHGCELVVHVAAKPGIWGPYQDYFRANVKGTRHVIGACLRLGISRLVYTSSPSVVFDGQDMEGVDESVPYPIRYKAAYPQTKAIAEREVLAANGDQLATVSLRPHLVWGPRDNHLIPGLISRGRAGKLRRVGTNVKKVDFTYVDDAARAHVLAAERLHSGSPISGKAYFITQGQPVPLWDFVNEVLELAGAPPAGKAVPASIAYAAGWLLELLYRTLRLSGEPPITRFLAEEMATSHWFDISAARRDLGYEPKVSQQEGFRRLKEWIDAGGLQKQETIN